MGELCNQKYIGKVFGLVLDSDHFIGSFIHCTNCLESFFAEPSLKRHSHSTRNKRKNYFGIWRLPEVMGQDEAGQ